MNPVTHESLKLDGYWKISWFGKLVQHVQSHNSLSWIKVYLTELDASNLQNLSTKKITLVIPIQELVRLHQYSLVNNGQPTAHPNGHFDNEVLIETELNFDKDNLLIFDRYYKHNNQLVINESQQSDLTNENNGLFLGVYDDHSSFKYVIPCIEIFRFFYASSSVLVNSLLSGHFLDPDSHLWSINKSSINSKKEIALWLRSKMLDSDARFLARFAFNSYALKQAQDIYLFTILNKDLNHERMIRALPPFKGKVSVKFYARKIQNNRMLITRFISCNWNPDISDIRWDRDNDGRKDLKDDLLKNPMPSWSKYPKETNAPEPTDLETTAGTNSVRPSKISEDEIANRFPLLMEVPIKKLPQNATTFTEPSTWQDFRKSVYSGSVVEGKSSSSLISKTIIESLEEKNNLTEENQNEPEVTDEIDMSVGIVDFKTILKHLSCLEKEREQNIHEEKSKIIDIEYISCASSIAYLDEIPLNVYPKSIVDKFKSWLYLNKEKTIRRAAFIVKVKRNGCIRYIIEIQHKRSGEYPTLVTWMDNSLEIDPKVLNILLMDCAYAEKAELTSAKNLGILWGKVRHTTTFSDSKSSHHFIDRVFSVKNDA